MYQCDFQIVDQVHLSPDLAPSDYYLSSNMKQYLAENQCRNGDDVISAIDDVLG